MFFNFTSATISQLTANGRASAKGVDIDPIPITKLWLPGTECRWLLTEIDPDDPDLAYGLCDLGIGSPEEGEVRLSELARITGPGGSVVIQDVHFRGVAPLSFYLDQAMAGGARAQR